MPNKIVIEAVGLSKRYKIARRAPKTGLRHDLEEGLRRPVRAIWHLLKEKGDDRRDALAGATKTEEFWALKDVSFSVRQGEVVGIIGRNGAGKSTLLKVLSRITDPTSGRVEIDGRIASLLEVGTGFHHDLTGRENIFLSGAILGMSRAEIRAKFDEIVDFAGVETFLDTPVKRYSSGMYVRLGFAVAAHLEPEILLVDEVLAVGDVEFQRKCIGKMQEVSRAKGRTVFLVSHNLGTVASLCSSAMYLRGGTCVGVGTAKAMIEAYRRDIARPAATRRGEVSPRTGSGTFIIETVQATKEFFDPAEPKTFWVSIAPKAPDSDCYFALHIKDEQHRQICILDSKQLNVPLKTAAGQKRYLITLESPWLLPGEYSIDAFIYGYGIVDKHEDACRMHVSDNLPYVSVHPDAIRGSLVPAKYEIVPLPNQRAH